MVSGKEFFCFVKNEAFLEKILFLSLCDYKIFGNIIYINCIGNSFLGLMLIKSFDELFGFLRSIHCTDRYRKTPRLVSKKNKYKNGSYINTSYTMVVTRPIMLMHEPIIEI